MRRFDQERVRAGSEARAGSSGRAGDARACCRAVADSGAAGRRAHASACGSSDATGCNAFFSRRRAGSRSGACGTRHAATTTASAASGDAETR